VSERWHPYVFDSERRRFVGSHAELRGEIDAHYAVLEVVVMPPRRMAIYLCEARL
jgi:hypothetical protein